MKTETIQQDHASETALQPATLGDLNRDYIKCSAKLGAVGDALYVLGGKWKLRIIIALCDGHKRFNEIQRVIEGITSKVLSSELKELELNGLVKRTVLDDKPVLVLYEPTEYTYSLNEVLHSLAVWGSNHREKLRSEL
ncbi:winged helix-turn-helix transcriptional regulator [Flavobacterium sp. F52]|uniref:winged helix-turn-helix transcriptional regulator n=1 Tax=Flavobacterium sp. F52 TaxID=1202532 RepID=UPI000272D86D|nr:helix-turn-helix domain-containing protein [Flavobacterium sp. F52]EJG03180.1 HxlR family transcriptional regulator [Flavobacterium sp. F52]